MQKVGALFPVKEGGGDSALSHASGASGAMDEALGIGGHVVVDDVGDVLYVDAARSHIGGYQDAVAPALESGESGRALRLRAVTVNHGRSKSLADQGLGQPLRSPLGACEDQAAALLARKQALQDLLFAVVRNFEGLDAHVLHGLGGRPEGQPHRVCLVIVDEACHLGSHGGGEAHRLALTGQRGHNAAKGGKKSHIHHAIGLIENEDSQRAEVDELAAEEVFQPAGSGNHQAGSFAEGGELGRFGQASHYQGCGRQALAAQGVVLVHHLHGQFARGDKHQRGDSGRFILQAGVR